ncbi:MAG: hypothetical protein HC913_15440 [Microscillaceae bacterium]|nr:hypothetical protein [Microscillaceae bacterium]
MKNINVILLSFGFLVGLTLLPSASKAQNQPFKVEVLENEFLLGRGNISPQVAPQLKIQFGPQKVMVSLPYQSQTLTLEIENTDCRAYCPKMKRVRQLHPGDEKLLKNLLEKEKAHIYTQLKTKASTP